MRMGVCLSANGHKGEKGQRIKRRKETKIRGELRNKVRHGGRTMY
jgi:hypothetical protein